MGSPKKPRRKYSKPSHPWQKARIEAERILFKEYGLRNKKEIWKATSLLRNFTHQTKKLIIGKSAQAEIEKDHLLKRLFSLGLLGEGAKLEDVLSISVKNLLDRRLQTLVYKKRLARTIQQARQFIVHRHIVVGDRTIVMPSYLVTREEEAFIGFTSKSALFNQDHPERVEKAIPKKETPVKKERKSNKKRKTADIKSDAGGKQ